jgi:SAM-dependent methyltransferase
MVRKWWIKCVAQQLLSHVPGGRTINGLWSRNVNLTFDEYLLQQAIRHVQLLRQIGFSLEGTLALEFGAGWCPTTAYVLRMAGCRKVILCDLNRLMTPEMLRATVRDLRERAPRLAESLDLDLATVESVLPDETTLDFAALLEQSGFEYRAPYDVTHTDYPDESIDVVSSRAVLEHVPTEQLRAIMKEMHRILRRDGAMVHTIDHSDHWEHFDHSISRINFLKFSQRWWKFINNDIAYQNRLRSCEHVALIRAAGFETASLDAAADPAALKDAHSDWIHEDYRSIDRTNLAVLTTYLVSRPA